jgi:hypothetical protein
MLRWRSICYWLFVYVCAFFCVCVQVEALRRADHSSNESYRLSWSRNWGNSTLCSKKREQRGKKIVNSDFLCVEGLLCITIIAEISLVASNIVSMFLFMIRIFSPHNNFTSSPHTRRLLFQNRTCTPMRPLRFVFHDQTRVHLPAILHSICLRGRILIKWRIMP